MSWMSGSTILKRVKVLRTSLIKSIKVAMFNTKGSAITWLLVVASAVVFIGIMVIASQLLSPEQLPPPTQESEKPPLVRHVVITDEEVLPLLPLAGARIHFIPGNKIQVGYKSIPIQPTLNLGVSEGMLWFSGIPSWIDLYKIDKNIDNYLSRWTPAWSFTVDILAASAASTITPHDGLRTANTTPTFDWANIADELDVKYSLEVDDDIDFSSPLVAKSKLYSPNYTLTDVEALTNGNYYWRVRQKGKLWIIEMPP